MTHKVLHLALFSCALILSIAVAVIFFRSNTYVALGDTLNTASDSDQSSILAAVNGAFSNRRERSHRGHETDSTPSPTPLTTPIETPSIAPTPTATQSAAIPAKTSVVTPTSTSIQTTATITATNNTISTLSASVVASTSVLSQSVPSPTVTPAPNTLGSKVGMSVGTTLYDLSDTDLQKELTDMANLKIGWLRLDIEWAAIQSVNSTTYDWTWTDKVIKAARAKNMQVLPDIGYTPRWARPSTCTAYACAPANTSDFANFAKAVVARYSPLGIHQYEIWNEENSLQFWQPKPDVVGYTNLLKAAYIAIKSVDPSAKVVTGGLAPKVTSGGNISPIDFVTGIYKQGAGAYFNALGIHPYTFPVLPLAYYTWSTWSQMSQTNPSFRSIMSANGDASKPIWITEFGAPTGGPGAISTLTNPNLGASPDHVDDLLQAQMMQEALSATKSAGSLNGPLFWYSYKDIGTDQSTIENFFGILRYDGTKKPAYTVLQNALK